MPRKTRERLLVNLPADFIKETALESSSLFKGSSGCALLSDCKVEESTAKAGNEVVNEVNPTQVASEKSKPSDFFELIDKSAPYC